LFLSLPAFSSLSHRIGITPRHSVLMGANKKAPHHKTVDALTDLGLGLMPLQPKLALKTLPIFL